MAEQRKPSLEELAEEFTLDPVKDAGEVDEGDPAKEEGSSRGARFRRTTRSFVMGDLGAKGISGGN